MAIKISTRKSTPVVSTSINSTTRSATVANVSNNSKIQTSTTLDGLSGVDLEGVQNGYTLVYDATTGNFEAAPASDVAANIQVIDGGTF